MNKVLQILPSLSIGGAEKFTIDLSIFLKSYNYDVEILLFNDIAEESLITTILEHKIKLTVLKGNIIKKYCVFFKKLLLENYNIVHSHLYIIDTTNLFKLFFPKILWINTIHNDAFEEQAYVLLRKVRGFFYRRKIITPVAISISSHKSFLNAYDHEPVLIENGIFFMHKSKDLNSEYKEDEKTLINQKFICSISRISEQKNIKRLVRLANTLDGIVRVIHIGPSYDMRYKKMIDSLDHNNIYFFGPKENISYALKNALCFILTSDKEGLPITCLEALANNLPIVSTNVGGISQLIQASNGVLVDINQEEDSILDDLKLGVIKMINSYDKSLNASKKIYENEYSMKSCGNKYLKLYQNK